MNPYTQLAKRAVENYVLKGEVTALPEGLPQEFYEKRAGVFVTLKKMGELRACIGTSYPVRNNIAGEIVCNAIAAATEDHRFGPVEETELPQLSYEVYVLSTPKVIKGLEELDPKRFGIIVKGVFGKSALLLPALEGIDTVDEQIEAACRKAGIDRVEGDYSIYRFSADKYEN